MSENRDFRFPSGVRVRGIGRDGENPRSLVLYFTDIPGDEDLTALHHYLSPRPDGIDAHWEAP